MGRVPREIRARSESVREMNSQSFSAEARRNRRRRSVSMTAPSEPVAELAVLLARGYLRLTQKRLDSEISDAENPHKPLDVSPPESAHVVGESAPEAPQ